MRKYFAKYKYKTFGAVAAIVMNSIAGIIGAFILSGMVNAATSGIEAQLHRYLLISVVYLFALRAIGRLDNYLQNSLSKNINLELRNDIFEAIIKESRIDFHKKPVGEYMSVITNDVDMISEAHVNLVFAMTGAVTTVVAAVISMAYINIWLLGFMMFVGTLYLIVTNRLSKNLVHYKDQWKNTIEQFTNQIKDLLSGYEVIQDFDLQDKSVEMFENASTFAGESKKKLSIKVDNLNNANMIIGQGVVFIIVFACAYLVTVNKISMGSLIALVQLMVSIISPLQDMTGSINELTSTKNIKNILLTNIKMLQNAEIDETTKKVVVDIDKLDNSYIQMEDVSFSYDGYHDILDHVNARFEHGKKYLIVGESGTGKSSLIGLFMNYYPDYKGKISCNGMDYRLISPESLSNMFTVVQQNVVLFDGTINDNITLFQKKEKKEVLEAAQTACLENLLEKKGLEFVIRENGASLSGGEKQRISIARAVLMKRKIMVLDEATSALDEPTAIQVLTNLLNIKDQTCIAILHHLPECVKNMFDAIFKLENGKLIEVECS